MIIGVVSDIHGRLSNKAYEALSGSDYILCAGDIENPPFACAAIATATI